MLESQKITLRQIVRLSRKNIAAIGALVRRSFATVAEEFHLTRENCPYGPAFQDDEALRKMLKHGAFCLGAFAEHELVGFVALLPRKKNFEMARLCVAPEYRCLGVGTALLNGAVTAAECYGAAKIVIEVVNENEAVKNWYVKHGFREFGMQSYPNLLVTLCEMEREL